MYVALQPTVYIRKTDAVPSGDLGSRKVPFFILFIFHVQLNLTLSRNKIAFSLNKQTRILMYIQPILILYKNKSFRKYISSFYIYIKIHKLR